MANGSGLLSFIKLTGDTFTFKPQSVREIGNHTIRVFLSDGQPLSTNYTFTITVNNSAPLFLLNQEPVN